MPDDPPRIVPGGPAWGPLPPVVPGLCQHGEAGPDGARACALPEGHRGDHDLTRTNDFQDRGDAARRTAGIDGTAGDAQDVPHAYQPDSPHDWCLLCGLAPSYRKHTEEPTR